MRSRVNSGIQRVVKSILREAARMDEKMKLYVPVEYNAGMLMLCHEEPDTKAEASKTLPMPSMVVRFVTMLRGRMTTGLKYILREFLPAPLLARVRAYRAAIMMVNAQFRAQVTAKEQPKINWPITTQVGEEPVLLLLDSSWFAGIFVCTEEFRARGGHVCGVLYDLIPFSHPETVQESTRQAHTSWWNEAPKYLDSVICISQAVANEFIEWQRRQFPENARIPENKISYFHLGSELPDSVEEIAKYKFEKPYGLIVGSIEPRKNHALALDAFEILWSKGVQIDLVIVGAHGWHSEALIKRMKTHTEFGKRLILIQDANDKDLATLYADAVVAICPSFAEGFGLSIVEAFQRGTRVLCSDIPVFREVAGKNAGYFSPFDALSLAQAISDVMTSAIAPLNVEGNQRTWLSWQESTTQLFQRIHLLANARAQR